MNNILVGPKENVRIPDVKISAVVQTFNAAEGLKQTLDSLEGKVDKTVVLDGFFRFHRGNPHAHPAKTKDGASTDNSEAVTDSYTAKWVPARDYDTQMDKLNRIGEYVPAGEWFIIVDTDEVVVSYVKDGLRALTGWFSHFCDAIPLKIDEPYYQHPWTGQYGRHRFAWRLMRSLPGLKWVEDGAFTYPGRMAAYAGTMPSTVYLRHLRKDPH